MPKITLPNVNERKHVHIINPTAGDGRLFASVKRAVAQTGEKVRLTEQCGDVTRFCREEIAEDPFVHLVVYGGDGTVHEAVNGIMASKSALTASFSVIPAGSGNDFYHWAGDLAGYKAAELRHLDLVKTTDGDGNVRYFANSLNLGFDGQAAMEAAYFKHQRGLRGSTAYIAGVAKTLVRKKPVTVSMTLSGVQDFAAGSLAENPLGDDSGTVFTRAGDTVTMEGQVLMTAMANGPFCGGGFRGAPLSSLEDGLLDVLIVRDMTRGQFLAMVGAYRKGNYMDEAGNMLGRYRHMLAYYHCKSVHISTEEGYCLDGEICPAARDLTVEIVPQAVWYAAL